MEKLFIKLFEMSISASYLILAVLVVRFVLRRAPKKMRSFLWLLVGIRLIVPFSVESVFSLIPDTKVANGYSYEARLPVHNTITNMEMQKPVNEPAQNTYIPSAETGREKRQTALILCTQIWLAGIAVMMIYMLFSYIRLKNRVRWSIPDELATERLNGTNEKRCAAKVYRNDAIESPFLFGIFRPCIYIPCGISCDELPYVLQHELTHKKRKDYLIKPAGFLLLSVYWFNPCVWAAYILLCKDIELICDECVVRELGTEHKKAYSQALLNSAVNHRIIAACPIAFGEVSVKERVKNVLHYKKPAFWALAAAVLACVIVPVCFMTQKKTAAPEQENQTTDSVVDLDELLTAGEYEMFYPALSPSMFTPRLLLGKDGEFSFGYDPFSSYLIFGKYDFVSDCVKAVTNDGKYHYQFTRIGDGLLRFDAEESSELHKTNTDIVPTVENGSIFIINSALSAINSAEERLEMTRQEMYEGRRWTGEELETRQNELEVLKQQLMTEELKLQHRWETMDESALTQEQRTVLNEKQEMLAQQITDVISQLEVTQAECLSMIDAAEKMPAAAKTIEQWAKAFCDRDAETILKLADEEVINKFIEQELLFQGADSEGGTASFGWSSPWPWGASYDENGKPCNYYIVSATEHTAEILYYAWVSDPHVTVWRELLTYELDGEACIITSESLSYMDGICIAEEFHRAYPNGIAETMMDYYLFNGAGEALNKNAKENQNSDVYKKLFAPDTAAISLLNILNNPNKVGTRVQESADETVCTVTFDFYEDNSTVSVQMIRPYGADGIWVPAFLLDLSDAHFIAQKQAEIAENREGGNLVYDHSLKINMLPLAPNKE